MVDDYKKIQQKEVDDNYAAFQKELPKIIQEHDNEYALMRNGKIIAYFSTQNDARKAGELSYQDHIFSIQQVTDVKVDLGYHSYHAIV